MKIKCLILSLLLLLQSVAVGAAYSEALTASDFEKHASLLSQLNINDGISKSADKNITRAEFVALTVRAINATNISTSEEYFADYANSAFKKEISTAVSMGITNGTSETTFSPDEGVTISVAAKMLITALGYKELAEAKGGYPTGYLSLAYSLDVIDNAIDGSALTVADAYSLIYNTMTAESPIITGINGEDLIIETQDDATLLTENFHFSHVNGIMTSADGYSLISGQSQKGKVCIGDTLLSADDGLVKYFGHEVDVWYDNTETVRVVLSTVSNKIVTIDAEDISRYAGNVLYVLNDNDKEIKYGFDAGFSFVENGRVVAHNSESFNFDEGRLTLIDNDSDGKYEIVLAQKPEYFVISSINAAKKTIYDKYSEYTSVSFDDDDDKYYRIEIDGESKKFSDLTENMVCEIYMSADNEVCLLKASKTTSVEGVLDEIGNGIVIVNDSTYKLNSYFKNKQIDLKPGTSYTFLIAPDGTVAGVNQSATSDMQYGYMLGYKVSGGLSAEAQIKLLMSNNKIESLSLASRVTFNGKVTDSTDTDILTTLMDGDIPKYQVVKFKVADGVVTAIDTEKQATLEEWDQGNIDTDNDSLTKYVSKKDVRWSIHANFGIPNVSFEKAVTFFIPADFVSGKKYDDKLFFCGKPSSHLGSGGIYTVDAYDYDASFCPGAVAIYFTDGNTTSLMDSISSSEPSYIVREITDAIDKEGDEVKLLKVFGNGLFKEFSIPLNIYDLLLASNKIPSSGDIIRISTNTEGLVNGITIDGLYDSETNTVSVDYSTSGIYETGNEFMTYFTGNVLSYGGSYMLINALSAPSDSVWEDGVTNIKMDSSPSYVVYNAGTGLVKAGTKQSVVAGLDKNDPNASFVVVRTLYFNAQTIFIYEK